MRPLLIVLLASSLLFLFPTLQYLIQRPLVKTTGQLARLHASVEEHLLFPISLIAGFLGLVLVRHRAAMHQRFRLAFLGALAATGLIAPIYLFGASGLAVSWWVVNLLDPEPRHKASWSGSDILTLFLLIVLALLVLALLSPAWAVTLLPFLIVVGLLAFVRRGGRWGLTLAAILLALLFFNLPFHLKASYRSLSARVKGDQRTMSVAIETYYLDHNAYPPYTYVPKEKAYWHSTSPLPTFRAYGGPGTVTLTTPVAYITSLFHDPFCFLNEDRTFAYYTNGLTYIVFSPGPDCVFDITSATLDLFDRQFTRHAPGDPFATLALLTYDPSNGAGSAGDVYRYKQ